MGTNPSIKSYKKQREPISHLWKKAPKPNTKDSLSRVVKTIYLRKRLSIVRRVNEVKSEIEDSESEISFTKLAKILNLC